MNQAGSSSVEFRVPVKESNRTYVCDHEELLQWKTTSVRDPSISEIDGCTFPIGIWFIRDPLLLQRVQAIHERRRRVLNSGDRQIKYL